jgi:hypothetical protein
MKKSILVAIMIVGTLIIQAQIIIDGTKKSHVLSSFGKPDLVSPSEGNFRYANIYFDDTSRSLTTTGLPLMATGITFWTIGGNQKRTATIGTGNKGVKFTYQF